MKEKYKGFEIAYDEKNSVFFIETEEIGRKERATLAEMRTMIDNMGKAKVAKQAVQLAIKAGAGDTELYLFRVGAFGIYTPSWRRIGGGELQAWVTRVFLTGKDGLRERVNMTHDWSSKFYRDTPKARAIIVERQKLLAEAKAVVDKIKKDTEKLYAKLPLVEPSVTEDELPKWG